MPQTHQLWESQSIIQDISLGGIYFVCDSQPPFEKDDIRHLTFDTVHNDQKIYRLKFHIQVVRTEEGQPDLSQFAVAIRFLSDPIYFPLNEINLREFPALDKTRIMYQYYGLNRMAYEIVQKTPEIRTDKINNIAKRLKQEIYRVRSDKLVQSFIKNLLQENLLIIKK